MGSNQQFLQPPDYDPRRLFPFGLSPIPEVPSEFASEVSSIASYSPTPSLDDSDTEAESVRSRGSILYSGSCDSIKSNHTIHGKSSSESSTDTEHSSDEETEDEAEGYNMNNIPVDKAEVLASKVFSEENASISNDESCLVYENSTVKHEELNLVEEKTIPITAEPTPSIPCDMVSGAATASEIFRHLQATRGKQEVTTELAKILTVLKSTLSSDDKDSSSSDEDSPTNINNSLSPIPTGKPPKPPAKIKFAKNSVVSPSIQARIRNLEENKPGNPKEEMNLLSKILVHLLCSCKTTAAAQELKRIIRQFKEVAKVAMEEGDDTLESLRTSSRASSRSSKRKARSRTTSGNSNVSGNSETDSMNTLTPGDSKSSGTDDELAQDPNFGKIRFTSNVDLDKTNESCVSYTLTLPLKVVDTQDADEEEEYEDDEEWEWEYEDELESSTPTKVRNDSSGSSRNLTPSEAKSDISTGSTRRILMDMELGAYNSQSDPGNSQSTPITEEEDAFLDEEEEDLKNDKHKKKVADKSENSEHLYCHLEETFKVLSDTYKIITTGSSPDSEHHCSASLNAGISTDKSFEDILDGVSSQCFQLESEILRSSRQSTAEPEGKLNDTGSSSGPVSRPISRSNSRTGSRPTSVCKQSNVTSSGVDNYDDDDEWEYYYEEDYEVETKPDSEEPSRILLRSRPASRQEIAEYKCTPHPVPSENGKNEDGNLSRPSSRIVKRPSSRISRQPSRASSRCSVKQSVEEEDWGDEGEWEYYYEEDYEEEPKAPVEVPRVPSRILMRSRPASRQEVEEYRHKSAPEKDASRPSSRIVKRPVSRNSRPPSRTNSRCSVKQPSTEEEDWGEEDEWEYYYEEEENNDVNYDSKTSNQLNPRVPSRQVIVSRVPSRQEVDAKKGPSRSTSRTQVKVPTRPSSKATNNENQDEEQWEYYYEEDYPEQEPANHSAKTPSIQVDDPNGVLQIKVQSRPNSRQSSNQSRPNSRSGSRPVSRSGSRPGSRTASRLKLTSALGNVEEEDEYEWYYDDGDDAELCRFSPTLTTAPTTRATSPFPDEKGQTQNNTGTGFSRRRLISIHESEETTPVPSKTPTNREIESATPISGSRASMNQTPCGFKAGYLTPAGVSVALAAEYLGQDAETLAASLPVNFIDNSPSMNEKKKKHKQKHKSRDKDSDATNDEGEEKKKKKKKKDGKFLPKVGVKELASQLESQLFQDETAGHKMIITREQVSGIIRDSKKKTAREEISNERLSVLSPISKKKEEKKRKSVREMVELMSSHKLGEPIENQNNIPSISVSSQMGAPPGPPPPPVYYQSSNHQYPQPGYQPYPVDVHAQYPQYSQSPHSPYQQYPPQSPYHQYPPQQYHNYQNFPPPPPPQHYQQYQQYPQYHPPQLQPYPGYNQNYPSHPPIVYQSENNPNQVKVVAGGQTTIVNMRQKNTGTKQKDQIRQNKSPDAQRNSPNDSEAYGTGSTGSDQTEGQEAGIDHDENKETEDGNGKPHKRHSRLFKLLQDSDYTDSDADSRSDYSRISMKNMEDNHNRESDIDSVCSGLERSGVERKHSFRSHKSSNKESDNDSVTSTGIERKISPNSVQSSVKHRRFMQLSLQPNYEPSSSELSTPNSPTGTGPDKRRSSSKPPSRVWNYHADDFDAHAGVSDDSSYQSLQSLNSFDSIYDNIAGMEVEEIMKRKVSRDNLYRYQAESPGAYVRASPKGVDLLRGSPKTHSSSPNTFNRNSPKLEQELLELTNFPSSPGLSLRQFQTHRTFYGGK